MQGFTAIDLIILIVYLAAVLFAGLHFAKKEMKGKEYFKGDGTVPWWVTSVSIFATLLSPISFLSLAGNSYAGSWLLWFAQLGMLLAIPVTIKFFLPVYSKLDIDTAYHYLELRFNSKGLRILGAVMFIIYQIGRMSIIMYLPCMVLSNLMGVSVNVLIIIMGVIAIIYSYTGGLKSVLWTDFIQGSVLLIGVTFGLIFLLSHIDGGLRAIFHEFTAGGKFLAADQPIFDPNILKDSVFLLIVGAGFNTMGSYVSSQDIVQRFTTTTDTKKLNKMMLANGGVKSAYEWFNGFMGLVLGILIGTFILGAFTKVANTFGAVLAFIAASGVMVYIKYFVPAENVSIWSYSIISIAVSLVVGIPANIIWRKVKGDNSKPAQYTTIYKD